jgi:hypothetical protein
MTSNADAGKSVVIWGAEPIAYRVRIGIDGALRVAEEIRALTSPSVVDRLLSVGAHSIEWQPADGPEADAWGEVTLELRVASEHDARRQAAKILAKVGIETS